MKGSCGKCFFVEMNNLLRLWWKFFSTKHVFWTKAENQCFFTGWWLLFFCGSVSEFPSRGISYYSWKGNNSLESKAHPHTSACGIPLFTMERETCKSFFPQPRKNPQTWSFRSFSLNKFCLVQLPSFSRMKGVSVVEPVCTLRWDNPILKLPMQTLLTFLVGLVMEGETNWLFVILKLY